MFEMFDLVGGRGRWRLRWWSLRNWIKGYQFRPVQRCRRCEHTTPYHYWWCGLNKANPK